MVPSTKDLQFLSRVREWIEQQGEILAEFCYAYMAGSRDFDFFTSPLAFEARLGALPARALVCVYREYDLSLRGVVDEEYISRAVDTIPPGGEYLIVRYGGWTNSNSSGEGGEELAEDLRGRLGETVAVGPYPDYSEANGNVLTAVVPDADGSVHVGAY